ncbi:MAG: helix-turn-helix transcriptional regulator [Phycisphaerae bacterium]|nr:helix-turn-helix transcriptional regulator [Phycisphaerae bacterium]
MRSTSCTDSNMGPTDRPERTRTRSPAVSHIAGDGADVERTGLAETLRRELDERDWTPGQLAARAGLHVSTVKAILKGDREPTVSEAVRLASALGGRRARHLEDSAEHDGGDLRDVGDEVGS